MLLKEVSTRNGTFRPLSYSLEVKDRIPFQSRYCWQEEGSLSRLLGRLYGLIALLHTESPHYCRTGPNTLPEHASARQLHTHRAETGGSMSLDAHLDGIKVHQALPLAARQQRQRDEVWAEGSRAAHSVLAARCAWPICF